MIKHILSKKNRILLAELVRTDFKLRYQGSVLGYAWSLLRPLLLFLILYVVFVKFLRLGNDIPHFPIYLLLGIVLWNFFAEMTSQSLGSIVGRGDLIRKIRIPRWIIVLSSSVSALINLGLNRVDITANIVWFPLILAEIYIFALGISLFLAASFVKYRDVSYIWEVIMQAAFYLTPIIYPLAVITDVRLQKFILLNPIAQAMQDARSSLVSTATLTIGDVFGTPAARLIPLTLSIAVLAIGTWHFKRESKFFAENL
jgi:ABC-2 type transport system permease protein